MKPEFRLAAVCNIRRDGEILLARKKGGFGAGKLVPPSGKIEQGETIKSGAVREILEETKLKVKESDLRKLAIINLTYFFKGTKVKSPVHIFETDKFEGIPQETEDLICHNGITSNVYHTMKY
ncbi:MAG: NUDIX domain-containing protein [Firmicutes bacterium]|nr:NUDIX domain-containing protein [Bacillota bacterium]